MGYRINERNTGSWSIDGEPKTRRSSKRSSKKLTEEDKSIMQQILEKVYDSLEYDEILSNGKGHNNPEAVFSDGGRFKVCMSREHFDKLFDILYKLA